MKCIDFCYFEFLCVCWVEVDVQGIVFNGYYLIYFDIVISGYWWVLVIFYVEMMKVLGGDFFVCCVMLDYWGLVCYDDWFDIGICVCEFGNSLMKVDGVVFYGEQMLVQVEMIYVFVDFGMQMLVCLFDVLCDFIYVFEVGQVVVDVEFGFWLMLGEVVGLICCEVFIEEQYILVDMEWDSVDVSCLYVLVCNCFGLLLVMGCMLEYVFGVVKIGCMVVCCLMCGICIGCQVLDVLMVEVCKQGYCEVLLYV